MYKNGEGLPQIKHAIGFLLAQNTLFEKHLSDAISKLDGRDDKKRNATRGYLRGRARCSTITEYSELDDKRLDSVRRFVKLGAVVR